MAAVRLREDLGLTAASFFFEGGKCVFRVQAESSKHEVSCGHDGWHRCEAAMPGTPPRLIAGGKPRDPATSRIAAHATWTDDDTLVMTWRYYETPHGDTLTCRFDGEGVTITFLNSITAMNPKARDSRAPLRGRIIS